MYQTLLVVVGKRTGRPLMATGALGHSTSRLFFVLERITHLRYLVDTGAEVSTIPPTKLDRQRGPAGLSLQAANGTQIPTFGTRSLTLNLGLRRPFRWLFIIADVKHPILSIFSIVMDYWSMFIIKLS